MHVYTLYMYIVKFLCKWLVGIEKSIFHRILITFYVKRLQKGTYRCISHTYVSFVQDFTKDISKTYLTYYFYINSLHVYLELRKRNSDVFIIHKMEKIRNNESITSNLT